MRIVNPPELGPPKGFSHGVLAPAGGRVLFVAGQTAGDLQAATPASFPEQFDRALARVIAVVLAAGGQASDIGSMRIFVTDIEGYRQHRAVLGDIWNAQMGRHYPAMAVVEVSRLVEPHAVVEIEATAIVQ